MVALSPLKPLVLEQYITPLSADLCTPVSVLMGLAAEEHCILLESAAVDGRFGRYSLLARDAALFIHCRQGMLGLTIRDDRLSPLAVLEGQPFVPALRELMRALHLRPATGQGQAELPPITRALYGYLGYGMAGIFNPVLADALPAGDAESCLMLPRTLLLFDHLYNKLHELKLSTQSTTAPAAPAPTAPSVASAPLSRPQGEALPDAPCPLSPETEAFMEQVHSVRERLRQGEGIQVVLSRRATLPYAGDCLPLYRRLRARNASPYMFYQRLPDITLLGASPEVMVRCTDGQLELAPIAGTRPRGKDAEEDSLLAAELLQDPKERAEHTMLVDLGRNDLGRVAKPGSVRMERSMEVQRFSHVMHLTSHISAPLREGLDALDVLAATFPAGTVSGAPKIRAMQIIAATEQQPRGPYAGCVAWLGLDKDKVHLDTGIIIRSLWQRGGRLHWQAGAGIVFDSSPEAEAAECGHKAAIMNSILRHEEDSHVCAHR